MSVPLALDEAAYFLRQFRAARYKALEDAEDFKSICFCLEELGCRLAGKRSNGLWWYKISLADFLSEHKKEEFYILFDLVLNVRNEFSHRGVFARNLALKAIKVSLILEGEIFRMITMIVHIMAENVISVENYHTLNKVREIMLENSFSYLPCYFMGDYYLVSDKYIAWLWNSLDARDPKKYTAQFSLLVEQEKLIPAMYVRQDELRESIYQKLYLDGAGTNLPFLVFDHLGEDKRLVGILAPFDLL